MSEGYMVAQHMSSSEGKTSPANRFNTNPHRPTLSNANAPSQKNPSI